MVFGVRASKYRHIYTEPPKPEQCWTGLRLSIATGEQQYVKASSKYFAVALSGAGGPLAIQRLDLPNRYTPDSCPIICGHAGSLLDFDWNPFDAGMIATASDDTTIKVWQVDADGEEWGGRVLSEPLVDLRGHRKKVSLLRYHPTAANVLASASTDNTIRVWDVEKAEEISVFEGLTDIPQDVVWDHRGDQYAVSSKDKHVRLVDGRTSVESHSFLAHEGTKSTKLSYLHPGDNRILSMGFTQRSGRELKVWDLRDTSTPVYSETIDQAAGVIMPFYDIDSSVLYLCGKGDGNIRYYEYTTEEKALYSIGMFQTTISCKGMCVVPKRAVDVGKNETARLLKITRDGVTPISLIVPRKSDTFQEDLFPDCAAAVPAHTADEWVGGSSLPPVTMSLDPADSGNGAEASTKTKFQVRGIAQVKAELKEALERIKHLESKLTEAGVTY